MRVAAEIFIKLKSPFMNIFWFVS